MKIVINDCYEPFFNSQKRYAVLLGGAGSGKSIAAVQKLIERILTEHGHRILCVRKVATTLRNSIYQTLQDQLINLGVISEFTINKSEMRFTHTPTGNELILHGLDDQEKVKSIAGITSVWCEEATELDEIDFNQLELRVRGETENYKQFIITFNPINEQHWLKRRFFDTVDSDVFHLKTTFKDNAFLDEEYRNHLLERVKINPNLYKVYVLGEWGKVDFGGEFLKCWKSNVHVGSYKYNPELAIYLSFDENVNPYFPCGFFQVSKDGKSLYLIHEIAAKNPNNTVKWMCREIERKLREWNHKGFVYITGDATSQKQDVKQEKGHDLFRLLAIELKEYNPIKRVSTSNPSVRVSADFFNSILETNYDELSFFADEFCRTAILDYENTKEDKNGHIDKSTVRDPVTKVSYQPYGHFVDLTRYAITNIFNKEYIKYQGSSYSLSITHGNNKEAQKPRF